MEELFKIFFGDKNRYDLSDGTKLFIMNTENDGQFDDLLSVLCENGFEISQENDICCNRFACLAKGDTVASLYYSSQEKRLRLIVEHGGNVPHEESLEACGSNGESLITQRMLSNLQNNAGMSYVIRLCDGRFLLIDGGYDEYDEAERLLEVLERQNTNFEKPQVAACIITHSHNDHLGAITRLIRDYSDRITFKDFIYNWPDPDYFKTRPDCEHTEFDSLVKGLTGVKEIRATTGQRFCYANATFDVLYSCDDTYPEFTEQYNNSSLVIMMQINGKKLLWTGDAGVKASDCLVERYGETALRCDVLQVPHHGYGGGTDRLHRATAPKILLWPAPDYLYRIVKDWSHNEYLTSAEGIKETYVSGHGEVTLKIDSEIYAINSLITNANDDFIYREDFNKERITDVFHSSPVMNRNNLVGANLRMESGTCRWINTRDGKSLLEILTPKQMAGVKSYRLTVVGAANARTEEFGILINHPKLTEVSEDCFLNVELESGNFELSLSANDSEGNAYIQLNGKIIASISYTRRGDYGLYLALKRGDVSLKFIEVEKT